MYGWGVAPYFFIGEARTFWIVNGRDTLDLKYLQWSGAPPASTIQGVDVLVDLQKKNRESSAKAVAKEKVPIQAHSPSSSLAPLQRQGNLSTLKFIVSWWNYPNMAFYLPLAVSQITRTVAVYIQFERI